MRKINSIIDFTQFAVLMNIHRYIQKVPTNRLQISYKFLGVLYGTNKTNCWTNCIL